MKIGIIVAMDKELHQLHQLFSQDNVRVEKCGIGKVNAALGAQRMIYEFHPDVLIPSGCAGGNGDDINIQDIIVGSEVIYHDVYCGKAIDDTTVYGQVQGLPVRYTPEQYLLERPPNSPVYNLHSPFTKDSLSLVTGSWIPRRRCAASSTSSPRRRLSIWSHVPSPRPVISTRYHSSPSG